MLPDDSKIVRVTPVFKCDDRSEKGYLTPLSVFPCFSKILEHITFNRFPKYLRVTKFLIERVWFFKLTIQLATLLFKLSSNIRFFIRK